MNRRSLLLAMCLLISSGAFARDPTGQYAESPYADWFSNAESKKGRCCGDADGYREGGIYKVWDGNVFVERMMFKGFELKPDGYHVTVYALNTHRYEEVLITKDAYIYDNPTGFCIIWLTYEDGKVAVKCFTLPSET